VRVTAIRPADAWPSVRPVLDDPAWADPHARLDLLDDLLDAADAALARLEEQAERLSPTGGRLTQGAMSVRHFAYLAAREQAKAAGAAFDRLDRAVEAAARPVDPKQRKGGRPPHKAGPGRPRARRLADVRAAWARLLAGGGLPDAPPPPADPYDPLESLRDAAADLLDDLALLAAMVNPAGGSAPHDAAPATTRSRPTTRSPPTR
jgi:hypothetical protein